MKTATAKQTAFIETLTAEKAMPLALEQDLGMALEFGALTSREASRFIGALLACPRKPRKAAAQIEEGFYVLEDGDYAKAQKAVHGSGNLYAKRMVIADGEASWEYESGLIRRMAGARKLTLEEAEAFGKLYGICCCCGRTLTNEESIERGIGPVCAGKL